MTLTEFMNEEGRRLLEVQRTEMVLELGRLYGPENRDRARQLTRLIVSLDEMIEALGGPL